MGLVELLIIILLILWITGSFVTPVGGNAVHVLLVIVLVLVLLRYLR